MDPVLPWHCPPCNGMGDGVVMWFAEGSVSLVQGLDQIPAWEKTQSAPGMAANIP